jgi:hypothetical protein
VGNRGLLCTYEWQVPADAGYLTAGWNLLQQPQYDVLWQGWPEQQVLQPHKLHCRKLQLVPLQLP